MPLKEKLENTITEINYSFENFKDDLNNHLNKLKTIKNKKHSLDEAWKKAKSNFSKLNKVSELKNLPYVHDEFNWLGKVTRWKSDFISTNDKFDYFFTDDENGVTIKSLNKDNETKYFHIFYEEIPDFVQILLKVYLRGMQK
jgi:predicted nuclease with TOPRIM domain